MGAIIGVGGDDFLMGGNGAVFRFDLDGSRVVDFTLVANGNVTKGWMQ